MWSGEERRYGLGRRGGMVWGPMSFIALNWTTIIQHIHIRCTCCTQYMYMPFDEALHACVCSVIYLQKLTSLSTCTCTSSEVN